MTYPKPAEIYMETGESFTVHHVVTADAGWLKVIEHDGDGLTYYNRDKIHHVQRIPQTDQTAEKGGDADDTDEKSPDLETVKKVLNAMLTQEHPSPSKVSVGLAGDEFVVEHHGYVEQFEEHRNAMETVGFEYDGERNFIGEGEARAIAADNLDLIA
jgi:hypothetical protein